MSKVEECKTLIHSIEGMFKASKSEQEAFRQEQSKMRVEIKDFERITEEYR